MNFREWSKSSVQYAGKLVNSAIAGGRAGESEFLTQEPDTPSLRECARQALTPAVLGACVGALGGYRANGRRSGARALACGLIGGAIGFGAALFWDTRHLTANVASGAWKGIDRVRDDR